MPVDDPATASAIRRHEERLQRDPSSLAFAQLADLFRKLGRTREAVAVCRDGLTRYPHYTTARLILAKALIADGELDGALTELGKILEVSPTDLESHRLAAEIHRRRGQIEAAVGHLETADKLDPGDRESRVVLGLLRGVSTSEAAGLGQVLRDDLFTTLTFGTACLEQGLVDEAAHVFTQMLRKDPDNTEARTGLEGALKARLRRKG